MLSSLFLLLTTVPSSCALSSLLQRTVDNWVSIGQQLQSDLYNASAWANGCDYRPTKNTSCGLLVTSRAVQGNEILSLYPIHSIQIDKTVKSTIRNDPGGDIICFDLLLDEPELYRDSGLDPRGTTCLSIQARSNVHQAGWLGHLATAMIDKDKAPNCMIVPLLGAAPLCALVSLGDLGPGEELCTRSDCTSFTNAETVKAMSIQVLKEYSAEIAELRSFTTMAHPSPTPDAASTTTDDDDDPLLFHEINRGYPGLKSIHQTPDILQIDNFLSPDECQRIIEKARPHLRPCLIKNEETGAVEAAPTRTSYDANLCRQEIPTIAAKVCRF